MRKGWARHRAGQRLRDLRGLQGHFAGTQLLHRASALDVARDRAGLACSCSRSMHAFERTPNGKTRLGAAHELTSSKRDWTAVNAQMKPKMRSWVVVASSSLPEKLARASEQNVPFFCALAC